MDYLCRDCLETRSDKPAGATSCPVCGSRRIAAHPELHSLSIAHLDCDAFYATVEKRDRPELKDKPVLVGGTGGRGVVTAACYVARRYGCRSAMPMYRARKLCPDAIVIRGDLAKYQKVGREVRALMLDTTPLVEPISIDEAFLDLTGTEKLHQGSPARTLAKLVNRVEDEIGITLTIGLSHNKFLAKIASDLDKPRGFAVIGKAETLSFLESRPISMLWGVGKSLQAKLARDGFTEIGSLRDCSEEFLIHKYGSIGKRLFRFSRGEDSRSVSPGGNRKSISAETTFADNLHSLDDLRAKLWPLCDKVAGRARAASLGGRVVTMKLKSADFRIRTRSRTLPDPTQLADVIWSHAEELLKREATGISFRLIGVGLSDLVDGREADPPDLANPDGERTRTTEHAMDALREKFGKDAIKRGRGLDRTSRDRPG